MSERDRFYRAAIYTPMDSRPSYNAYCYRVQQHAVDSAEDLKSRWTGMRGYTIEELTPEQVMEEGLTIRDEPLLRGAGHRVQL